MLTRSELAVQLAPSIAPTSFTVVGEQGPRLALGSQRGFRGSQDRRAPHGPVTFTRESGPTGRSPAEGSLRSGEHAACRCSEDGGKGGDQLGPVRGDTDRKAGSPNKDGTLVTRQGTTLPARKVSSCSAADSSGDGGRSTCVSIVDERSAAHACDPCKAQPPPQDPTSIRASNLIVQPIRPPEAVWHDPEPPPGVHEGRGEHRRALPLCGRRLQIATRDMFD